MESLVSVIIPTYNRANFIIDSIESVLAQTYSNFEIIVVDDNSSDNTAEVIAPYLYKYNFISYVKHDTNRGGSAARNTGAKMCKGEYIAFLDSDDKWHESKLEKIIHTFKQDSQIGLVYSDFYAVNANTKEVNYNYCLNPKDSYFSILCENFIGTTSLIVLKKEVFDSVGGFKEGLPSCQDWEFYINVLKKFKIKKVEDALVYYLVHENSISGNLERVIAGHIYIYEKVMNLSLANNKKKRIESIQFTTIARLYRNFRDFNNSKKYYYRAFKSNPFNIKALKNSVLCLFGKNIYYRLLESKL